MLCVKCDAALQLIPKEQGCSQNAGEAFGEKLQHVSACRRSREPPVPAPCLSCLVNSHPPLALGEAQADVGWGWKEQPHQTRVCAMEKGCPDVTSEERTGDTQGWKMTR